IDADRAFLLNVIHTSPFVTVPVRVLVLALGLYPNDLGHDARKLDLCVAVRHGARLEQTYADLRGILGRRAVGQLCIEVRIDVTVADPPERGALALYRTHGADSE